MQEMISKEMMKNGYAILDMTLIKISFKKRCEFYPREVEAFPPIVRIIKWQLIL